jgi:hypothetical protein
MAANEVNSWGRTVSKKQAVKDQRLSVQELETMNRSDEQFWQGIPNSIDIVVWKF